MRPWVIALLAGLACAAPAAAAETTTTIPGAPGPGPSRYDKVFVTKFGPKSVKRVLVLMPGYYGGAGDFTLDARELVKRVPGVQAWAVDRRSEALEDTSRFGDALAGRISVQQALDYYLGWLTDPAIQPRFQPLDQAQFGFAKQWGLSLALQDVRRVVLSARRQGKRVILGGHSLGASITVAYASWDFGGHPGYEDLDGLVLIDGGLLGSFSTPDLAATKKAIAQLDAEGPFADLLGLKLPWAAGVFAEVGALAALKEPTARSRRSRASRRPSPRSRPTRPSPAKLSIDVDAVNVLTPNAQTDYLKLRRWHRRDVDLPLYALQTDLTNGRVLRGARRFIAGSKVPRSRSVLVDASSDESHLDPLTAAPARSRFLKSVVPFLRSLRQSS